ncbi:gamma-aminobutyric acid receptor subunit beta-like isoform X1 [Amphibalanus amphitrite]|uniref:gamma-aminobutyric acid receptor subunit beta-like isoform X1 n=1 Tax=Amphibalanus amphitrite TaxID=1232801 RepID=UPI001C91983E|nr:gamma-aminobutyric acid receptor subunit beta-like isoform X1 [Amphibalanus amphitrite]
MAPPAAALLWLLGAAALAGADEDLPFRTVAPPKVNKEDVNISAILDNWQQGYDKRLRPNYGGPAVDVGITMHVVSISSLSEVKMDFTIDFFFRQFWRDPRMAYDGDLGIETLTIGTEFIKNIWVPDTYFPNEKTSYYHEATASNEFLRIRPTGDILRSIRLTITASCPMSLQYFPMDRQMCDLQIESFGYATSDIRYMWLGDAPIQIDRSVQLPQFDVKGHKTEDIVATTSTGNYSRLKLNIQFERSMGYYLIQMYVPSGLIVVISWVSFWLNRNATPARVALGVTTVLTMTTLMSSTNAALPKISYIKAIDVYLGYCFVMVFASLLEYAYVGYIGKRISMRKTRYMAMQKMLMEQRQEVQSRAHSGVVVAPEEHTPKSAMGSMRRGHAGHPGTFQGHAYQGHMAPQCHDARDQHTCQHFQEVRYKALDPKAHSKGAALENTVNGGRSGDDESGGVPGILQNKKLDTIMGCSSSDVDKYSRIVFPVTFICFNLMYWIIYLHVSDKVAADLVPFVKEA